jgi:hypothetical protein
VTATTVPEKREELLEPIDGLGVEVVGRLVEQQHVGLGQQQLAQGHPALFAARDASMVRLPGRQAQRIGGNVQLVAPIAGRGDDGLELGLLGRELVKVGIRLGIGRVDLVELCCCASLTCPMPLSTASRTEALGSSLGSCGR